MSFSPESTEAIQRAAERAASVFPWYRRLLESGGYGVDRDPGRLPIVDDALLSAHYYQAGDVPEGACQVYRTSGTTFGTRKRVYWSDRDHADYLEQRTRVIGVFLGSVGRTACSDLGTGHAASSALEIFRRLGRDAFAINFEAPIEKHVAQINARRPDILFTMPMILDRILAEGSLRHQPKKVIVLGDVAPLVWQQGVAERFGIDPGDVLDLYGSIEVGAIAYYMHREGHYVFHEHILPETLPVEPAPLERGVLPREVLVLTSLARGSFPAVRFLTGDLVVGLERCLGGGGTWRCTRLDGRVGPELKHGEKLSLYSVAAAVNAVLPLAHWEAERSGSRLVVRIEASRHTDDAALAVRRLILEQNPDVAQMVRSGLVADIVVVSGVGAQSAHKAKHLFREMAAAGPAPTAVQG